MVEDARSFRQDQTLQADLCIVGAGVAGLALARSFVGSAVEVVVVESGGGQPTPETQALAAGENTGEPYYDLPQSCKRAVGGSSWCWNVDLPDGTEGVRLRALDAIDFEERPGLPHSGWPLSRSDLTPYYRKAHERFRLGPFAPSAGEWDALPAPPLPLDGARAETMLFQFGPAQVFREEYPEQLAAAANVTILTNATVLELATPPSARRVQAAWAKTLSGTSVRVESAQFVVAAGGLQTPRLLLLSDEHQPGGLGNQNDQVGRYFMEHLHANKPVPDAGTFVPSRSVSSESLGLYHDIQSAGGTPVLGYLTLSAECQRSTGLANYCCHFRPNRTRNWHTLTPGYKAFRRLAYASAGQADLPDQPVRRCWQALRGLPHVAHAALERTLGEHVPTPESYTLYHMAEQRPNPDSRVMLGDSRDAFGQPRVRLDWHIPDRDLRNIQRAQEELATALADAGAGRLLVPSLSDLRRDVTAGGHHHMGTTRMSETPETGVVDADCKVFGVENLYIAGPSVFATSGCANPTLTIVALALRLADHLRDTLDA